MTNITEGYFLNGFFGYDGLPLAHSVSFVKLTFVVISRKCFGEALAPLVY